MNTRHQRRVIGGRRKKQANLFVGLILLVVGSLLFARELGVNLPGWIFRWEMILVVVGISIGIKSKFKDFGWIAVTGIGLFFLSDNLFPDWEPRRFIFPAIVLTVGAFIILQKLSPVSETYLSDDNSTGNGDGDERPDEAKMTPRETETPTSKNETRTIPTLRNNAQTDRDSNFHRDTEFNRDPGFNRDTILNREPGFGNDRTLNSDVDSTGQTISPELLREEEIEIVSVFSAVNRKVFSKNFVGGEVVCVFGGSEVNLMNADIMQSPITVEVVCVFGGATLFIPPNWNVRSEMGSVFGGVDDKRKNAIPDANKTIIINGVCIFGGLEIKTKF